MKGNYNIILYIVDHNEDISKIAEKLNLDVKEIVRYNPNLCPYFVYPGQRLNIPIFDTLEPGSENKSREAKNEGVLIIKGVYAPPSVKCKQEDWRRWVRSSVIRIELENESKVYFDTNNKNARDILYELGIKNYDTVEISYTKDIVGYYEYKPIYNLINITKLKSNSIETNIGEVYV